MLPGDISTFMVSLIFPFYYGLDDYIYNGSTDKDYSISEMDDLLEDDGYSGVDALSIGIDLHYMEPFAGIVYYSLRIYLHPADPAGGFRQ